MQGLNSLRNYVLITYFHFLINNLKHEIIKMIKTFVIIYKAYHLTIQFMILIISLETRNWGKKQQQLHIQIFPKFITIEFILIIFHLI